MRALASKAGKITNVEMGRRGMMSWVTYSTPSEASKALTLTVQMIGERDVRVELATRDPNAPPREKSPRSEFEQFKKKLELFIYRTNIFFSFLTFPFYSISPP